MKIYLNQSPPASTLGPCDFIVFVLCLCSLDENIYILYYIYSLYHIKTFAAF